MKWIDRFKNSGTVISVVCLTGLLLMQFGFSIDVEWLQTTTEIFCTICIILGIMNNPTTEGLDNPFYKGKRK